MKLISVRDSTFLYEYNAPIVIILYFCRYVDDFKPIIEGCECLACQKHTKAYIYHLVTVQELLGPLLLTM